MTKEIKNILLGVVIGAIVVAGGQYAWSKYQDGVKAKNLSVSMQGLKTATDKTAYLDSYFSSQPKPTKGVSIGLSNSSADEGGGYCSDLRNYIYEITDYTISCTDIRSGSYNTSNENCVTADWYFTLAKTYWYEADCSGRMD